MSSTFSSEEHGGIDPQELRRLGLSPAGMLDFSVNSNPFGPSPRVLAAIRAVDVSAYPDRECSQLRERLAEANQTAPERVLVGNGTAELIWLATRAFLRPGDRVLIAGPTFGEYRRAAIACGADVVEIRAAPEDFHPPLEALLAALERPGWRMVFLCNPNNPTGQALSAREVQAIADRCGVEPLLVVDEAYRAFAGGEPFAPPFVETALTLRSMTKDFALAGLRLGYLLASPGICAQLKRLQPAWSVNAVALAAGAAALADRAYYQRTLAELKDLRTEFFARLAQTGTPVCPTQTHFGLLRFARPAAEIRRRLLQEGIQVRDCASFGLPEHVRIATRLRPENERLIAALERLRLG
jgi:histidinol-phosphate aminotransferase